MGYREPTFEFAMFHGSNELDPQSNFAYREGDVLEFKFTITAGYDTQFLQVKHKI